MGQKDGRDDERPVHLVTLAPFRLSRLPVTNADFAAFRPFEFTNAVLPVTFINWFQATEYCAWLSAQWGIRLRLPTEAEWEFAARGGLEQSRYPWGNAPPETRAGYAARWLRGPEPVGTAEPNAYGLFDLCENVHEWCSDWYAQDYYTESPSANPQGAATGLRRASRGGAWRHHIKIARCAARSSLPPDFRYADYGFRVAADA